LFTQALTIAQGLAEAEPGNTVYQRDLSISYERLAHWSTKNPRWLSSGSPRLLVSGVP
jgi:hypothetical protein